MATYYVDSAGSNTSPYDTWAKAATSLQTAINIAAATDIIYMRGTQTLTTAITFTSANQGSITTGKIKIIGCNSSGIVDGTLAVIDGNTVASPCLAPDNSDCWQLENIEIKNSAGAGFDLVTSCYGWVLINCHSHDNAGDGFELYRMSYSIAIHCSAYSNSLSGFDTPTSICFYFCSSYDNVGDGFDLVYNTLTPVLGCIAYGNSGWGFGDVSNSQLIECIAHDNALGNVSKGTFSSGYTSALIFSRITGAPSGEYGLDAESRIFNVFGSYFQQASGGGDKTNDTYVDDLKLEGSALTTWAGTDTNYGYNSPSTGDFNLTSAATMRDVEIELP